MAVAKIKKIRLIANSRHSQTILETLQNLASFEIISVSDNKESKEDLQKSELDYANVEFAIKLLTPYGKKPGLFDNPMELTIEEVQEKAENFDFQKIVDQCLKLEEVINSEKNTISSAQNQIKEYHHWEKLNIPLEHLDGTDTSMIFAGTVKKISADKLEKDITALSKLIEINKVHSSTTDDYLTVICDRSLEKEVRSTLLEYKFTETDFPQAKGLIKDYCKNLHSQIDESTKKITETQHKLKELAKNLDELKIAHDYLLWQLEKTESINKSSKTAYNFILTGWAPEKLIPVIENELGKITKEFALLDAPMEEGEEPPVAINNNSFFSPFEAVTRVYGLPRHDELDPTPYLSTFFIIYFGLCLTDAGYGILMFIVMALILKYFKLPVGTRKLAKLLMYGGLVTVVIGTLFGGWFGLEIASAPAWMTYTTADGEKMFLLQIVNSLTDPITVLVLSLSLGFLQITVGTYMKFFFTMKHVGTKDALLDTGPWVVMLTGIGFTLLSVAGVLPESFITIGKYWLMIAAILVILTQGREKKSIIGKLLSGVLGLYNLVGYMSDVLSYSRLLALGLATAIIALAVNTIAVLLRDMIPYVGWVLMAVVLVGGHLFNLAINALGSFIHSGRLQFVEFFGKFMEGGGTEFRPFSKKMHYIFLKEDK